MFVLISKESNSEIWAKIAEYTGEDEFRLTTQDLKDYSELMDENKFGEVNKSLFQKFNLWLMKWNLLMVLENLSIGLEIISITIVSDSFMN